MDKLSGDISIEVCRRIEEHAREIMSWRNDPTTLSMFFHHEPKVWDSFWKEYCDEYLNVEAEILPVFAIRSGERVGFLRFGRIPHPGGLSGKVVDISINVNPQLRGQGLGTRILNLAREYLRERGVDTVYAEVLKGNEASLRAFAQAGFRLIGEASKLVPDTRETHVVHRYVAELTSVRWRQGRVYVIAEAGSNWRMGNAKRDLAMARTLIDVAVEAGADAVKFQTYKPESVYVSNAGASEYLSDAGITEDIREIFADLSMPYEMLPPLAEHCETLGIDFMSTPFSPADFAAIDPFVRVHKIASYEISHVHLLRLAARAGKPLVLSTGASTPEDIAWAVETFQSSGGQDLCLLQCTAKYPAPMASLNLRSISWLRTRFAVASGLSDHSREAAVAPVVAVALGARVIEKHYTLHNRLPGPDHSFALTPDELAKMIREVRLAEETLGDGIKRIHSAENELAAYARRGLQASRHIHAGEMLREGHNFEILRPGQQKLGVHPRFTSRFEGRLAGRAIAAGRGLAFDDLAE